MRLGFRNSRYHAEARGDRAVMREDLDRYVDHDGDGGAHCALEISYAESGVVPPSEPYAASDTPSEKKLSDIRDIVSAVRASGGAAVRRAAEDDDVFGDAEAHATTECEVTLRSSARIRKGKHHQLQSSEEMDTETDGRVGGDVVAPPHCGSLWVESEAWSEAATAADASGGGGTSRNA